MMVIIVERFHLFPFRTQKLSFHASKIFGWRRPEKIDRCHQPYVANSPCAVCDFFMKKLQQQSDRAFATLYEGQPQVFFPHCSFSKIRGLLYRFFYALGFYLHYKCNIKKEAVTALFNFLALICNLWLF